MDIKEFIDIIGVQKGMHLMVHSSIRKIRKIVPDFWAVDFISSLTEKVTQEGSIIMPAFTYNFKRSLGRSVPFDQNNSESRVGDLSEVFRTRPGVIRTSSPTHSFSLWGDVKNYIYSDNSPASPLGEGSVLEWMTNTENSYILLLGVNFTSLSYCYFLEGAAKISWHNTSPWDHLNILPIGISVNGEQKLREVPGCARSFINFENYLLSIGIISRHRINDFNYYLLPVDTLYKAGMLFFKKYSEQLICKKHSCQPCDERRLKLKL